MVILRRLSRKGFCGDLELEEKYNAQYALLELRETGRNGTGVVLQIMELGL